MAKLVGSVTRRRLLMTPDSSSGSSEGAGGTGGATTGSQTQQQQQQAAGGAVKAATVEADPSSKGGLSKEALESFALFEDPTPAGTRGPDTSGTGTGGTGASGSAAGGALGADAAAGAAKAAGGLAVQPGLLGEPQNAGSGKLNGALELPAKTTVDEFGDTLPAADLAQQRLEAAAAGVKEAHGKVGGSREDQLQDEFAQLYGGDYVVGDGKFLNAGDWEDEMYTQVSRGTAGGGGKVVWRGWCEASGRAYLCQAKQILRVSPRRSLQRVGCVCQQAYAAH